MRIISLNALADRAQDARRDRRHVVGIAGPPAAGKSTLAAKLSAVLDARASGSAAVAPMDGFHLPTAVLASLGALDRKGGPDTFDVAAFVARLRLLRDSPLGVPVPWPIYDRVRHDPVEAGVVFDNQTIALVEGNYLLLDTGRWAGVAALLDDVWYLDAPLDVVERRLIRRHVHGGKSEAAAERKVHDSDLPNARLIAGTKSRANLVLRALDDGRLASDCSQVARNNTAREDS